MHNGVPDLLATLGQHVIGAIQTSRTACLLSVQPKGGPMSVARMTSSRARLTVVSAVVALAGSGVVAANLAGAASGPSVLDYAQCQNGAPNTTPNPDCNWINGILNAS